MQVTPPQASVLRRHLLGEDNHVLSSWNMRSSDPKGCCMATTSPAQTKKRVSTEDDLQTTENYTPTEMRVLAVDDNNIDRKLIEMLLRTSSFKVTAVNSVKRALEVLGLVNGSSAVAVQVLEVDLIITDYCMPEMTGYDLLKRVKHESSACKDVPVVIMSSENVPFRINRCMAEGAEEFLIKPVQLSDVNRLKRHVRQGILLRESSLMSDSSSKRKGPASSQGRPVQSLERRQRLSELTVA